MKYLIHTTQTLKYTQGICKEVTAWYKDKGLDVKFSLKKTDVDVSNPNLYGLSSVWTILKMNSWWSVKKMVLKYLYNPNYDGVIFFVDSKKTPKKITGKIRGLHTPHINGSGLIEVYSSPKKYAAKKFDRNGKNMHYFTNSSKRNSSYKEDVYLMIHEIAHNLDYRIGKNQLHQNVRVDNFEGYIEEIISKLVIKELPKAAYRIDKVQPLVDRTAKKLERAMKELGMPIVRVSGFRSFEEQNKLYNKRPKVTNAKGGESFHNYGVAVDYAFLVNGKPSWAESNDWDSLGQLGEMLGFEWGGVWKSFKDRPHFQMKRGYSLKDFQKGKIDWNKYL